MATINQPEDDKESSYFGSGGVLTPTAEIPDSSPFVQRASTPLLDVYSAFPQPLSPKTSISLDRPSNDSDRPPLALSPRTENFTDGGSLATSGSSKKNFSRPSSFLQPSKRTSAMGSGITQQSGGSLGLNLTSNAMFYDIPIADPLTELLEKYLSPDQRPIRDLGGIIDAEKAKNPDILQELISTNAWRALTRVTRQKITTANSTQIPEILQLWYLRLLALTRLRLYQLAQAELDKLGDLDRPELYYEYHPGLYPGKEGSMVPWELWVLWIRLPGWMGEVRLSLERCISLGLVVCKKMSARYSSSDLGEEGTSALWNGRESQLHLLIVNYLMELADFQAAESHLTALQQLHSNDLNLLSGLGRLHLQLGNIEAAKKVFDRVESQVEGRGNEGWRDVVFLNRALQFIATGDWEEAKKALVIVVESSRDNIVAINNLAVCELYNGTLKQAINQLEHLLAAHPTTAGTCEPLVFNLCTLYELRSEMARDKKVALMKEIGGWAGDEFGIDCLKLG